MHILANILLRVYISLNASHENNQNSFFQYLTELYSTSGFLVERNAVESFIHFECLFHSTVDVSLALVGTYVFRKIYVLAIREHSHQN